MGKYTLFIPWLILIIAACTPTNPPSSVTHKPTSTRTTTATMTITMQATIPEPTETPGSTITPSPEVFEPRTEMVFHVVQTGETTQDIAEEYQLSTSSVLYSNFEILPQELAPGMTLIIPPIDGFYYVVKAGEDLPKISHRFGVSIISILSWPENGLDQEIEAIEPGKMLFIPGGKNPDFDWSTATPLAATITPSP
jgi:LysM repeat protein